MQDNDNLWLWSTAPIIEVFDYLYIDLKRGTRVKYRMRATPIEWCKKAKGECYIIVSVTKVDDWMSYWTYTAKTYSANDYLSDPAYLEQHKPGSMQTSKYNSKSLNKTIKRNNMAYSNRCYNNKYKFNKRGR